MKQECIPVGGVPPAAVAVGGEVSPPGTPQEQAPPGAVTPPDQTPPGPGTLPVNRILDTRLWKYSLAPNFVCGR